MQLSSTTAARAQLLLLVLLWLPGCCSWRVASLAAADGAAGRLLGLGLVREELLHLQQQQQRGQRCEMNSDEAT
jgi:hypothetical protein